MVEFACNLRETGVPLNPVWSHTIGSGHAALALRADWQAQMRRAHRELGCRYVRFHALLSDDMATALVECDKLLYGFYNIDQVFDFLIDIGMRPFVELSFMPSAFQSGDQTVFNYRANVTPPRDWSQWSDLIGRLARHWVDRYGLDEVRQWFFEVWNEPNLDAFWSGGQAGYFRLYESTANAIKAVDAQLRVGGPATANDEWIAEFLDFCAQHKLPVDFVSTHHYPTDALGKPGDDTERQLSLAARDVLPKRVRAAVQQARGKPVYYTEWSTTSNPFFPRHDEPYAAAFVAKNFLEVTDVVQAYSYWTFSDIFAENYFSSVPFHGGFGLLTIHGIAKPSYRAVQLLHRLGSERLTVAGSHATVDAWVVRGGRRVVVLLTNHAFPGNAIDTERVSFTLTSTALPTRSWLERIDEGHCNPRRLWEAMGSPDSLSRDDVAALQAESELRREVVAWTQADHGIRLELDLPAHGVASITLDFAA